MLPILGVIALGIVIVGIKILWTPGASHKTAIVAQPRQAQPAAKPAGDHGGSGAAEKQALSDVTFARPVQKSASHPESKGSAPSVRPAPKQDAPQPPTQRAEPKKADPAPKSARTQPVRVTIDSSAFVVQCGSYTTRAAANSVVTSLKKTGYSAVVRRAEVNGKTFFRVIVAGGADRAEANEVAEAIKAAGHPVFVRPND